MSGRDPGGRNPVLWLVVALPAIAIAAGIGLVVVAVRTGGNDAVPDEVRRTAQVQVADLGPDEVARREGLRAVLSVDREAGRLRVLPAAGDFDPGAPMRLDLGHPIRAAEDISIELAPDGSGWAAGIPLDAGHDWSVRLVPPDGRWRLQGRLRAGEQAAVLVPSLAEDGGDR